MAERNPLQRYLPVQVRMDRQMATILFDAADHAEKLILEIGDKGGVTAAVERVRLREMRRELRDQGDALWRGVQGSISRNYGPAALAAAEATNEVDRGMFKTMGLALPEYHAAVMLQAIDNVPSLIARGVNNIPLAESVYGTRNLADGWVDQRINRAIALGKSAKDLAKDVRDLIRPDVRGGVSYAAMRLGRTELNNAFHRTHITLNGVQPWVAGMKWNLSNSHPENDECDQYAGESHFRGGEAGVFRTSEVPSKPHPQCLCFLTTVQVSEEEFLNRLVAGDYDEHLNDTLADSGLSQKRVDSGQKKVEEFMAKVIPISRPSDRGNNR